MEDILRNIYQEQASRENSLGILQIYKKPYNPAITNTFDVILLVIVSDMKKDWITVKHYQFNHTKIALHIVSDQQLKEWLLLGTNRKIVEWVHVGKILFDKNDYLYNLQNELQDFPLYERSIKMGIEFAKLIRSYWMAKVFFETKQYLDAYNHTIHSLHHLARLSIIEKGLHPELTVWNQVKQLEPEIYKLYEELIKSEEPIEKRLKLLFIASEFLIYSRTSSGAKHLLKILSTQSEWNMNEMKSHPELAYYGTNLNILVEYLVEKELIEPIHVDSKTPGLFHIKYKLK
ncbi:nucleotidyltransferase-like protein [Lederbergia sp. NSJ-179]|uniref:nucleotidyltransferase-like protein n=1 Tax=Lederbergia sp. NSJ-179 TaxID=2931402 RepID=UPI001FD486FC|nr:nucleotidyltransferase-like protein [Lederbergia sp. NSJ-179]MCJ7843310.1 nucleotidyltransferase-like protein [Lederbergia sp. NSJ-179]